MPKMTAWGVLWTVPLLWALPAAAQVPAKPTAAQTAKAKSAPTSNLANTKKKKPSVAPALMMGPEEMAIAERVHQGHLPCELGATVRLEADGAQPGYFFLHGKGFRYRMHPVVTSTGAIRLEDRKAGAVWLQLANKSMLMDQKKGRRVADECASGEQLAYAETMKTNPPPSLIDTTGTGQSNLKP